MSAGVTNRWPFTARPPGRAVLATLIRFAGRLQRRKRQIHISQVARAGRLGEDTLGACPTPFRRPSREYLDVKPPVNAEATSYDFLEPAKAADEMGRLGPYRILLVLGAGAMGVVFLAEDTRNRRQVALKALKPNVQSSDQASKRFLREGKATADLKNDHVVAIYDVGQSGDVPYLAMEYLRGETLETYLQRSGRLPVAALLRLGRRPLRGWPPRTATASHTATSRR